MIKLTITTIRLFDDDNEYESYKQQTEPLGVIDFGKLEAQGSYEIKSHNQGEKVITQIKIEEDRN